MFVMKNTLALVLLLLICTVAEHSCSGEGHYRKLATTNKVYLKPTNSDGVSLCPQNYRCVTLSTLLGDNASYFVNTSNTTVHFLPGTHTVTDIALTTAVVHNVSNLTLSGACSNTGHCPPANVRCNGTFSFIFSDVSSLKISNIAFIECGAVVPERLSDFVYSKTSGTFQLKRGMKAALAFRNIHSLLLRNVTVMKSRGYGILGLNLLGNSTIVNSQFLQNNYQTRFMPHCNNSLNNWNVATCEGGNAMFLFYDTTPHCPETTSTYPHYSLAVYNSTIAHGIDLSSETYLQQGGASGIVVIMSHRTYYLSIVLHNVSLFENSGNVASGFIHDFGIIPSHIQVTESSFHHQKKMLVKVWANPKHACFQTAELNATITFSKCVFSMNEVSGLLFLPEFTKLKTHTFSMVFHVQYCQFFGHRNKIGHSQSYALQIEIITADVFNHTKLHVKILNCLFHNNKMTSTGVWVYQSTTNKAIHLLSLFTHFTFKTISLVNCILITIKNCRFFNNTLSDLRNVLHISRALLGQQETVNCVTYQQDTALLEVAIQNCTFTNNVVHDFGEIIFVNCIPLAKLNFVNSTVSDNSGTAIAATKAVVTFKNINIIANNTGFNGGGLFLDSSYIALVPQSKLHLLNNSAKNHGGGIFATTNHVMVSMIQIFRNLVNRSGNLNTMCAFQFYGWNGNKSELKSLNISVIMVNNKAQIAGDSIYGAPLEHCVLIDESKLALRNFNTDDLLSINWSKWLKRNESITEGDHELFSSVLEIKNNFSQSEIASESYKLCPCFKDIRDCNKHLPSQLSVYPGKNTYIPVAAVGQFNGTSPALIFNTVCEPEISCFYNPRVSIGMGQRFQVLDRGCSNFVYTINTDLKSVTIYANFINLSAATASHSNPYIINVTVLPCLSGFMLKGSPPKCECMDSLIPTQNVVDCDTHSQKVHKILGTWIAPYEENSSKILFHKFCPFDYCKLENILINFSNPDEQCAFNRSGVLCGACKPGLSLALGTSQCLQCPNTYLLLIIPFALAGVGLVLLLLKCNLTVSVGTINGLIFYANIVRANQAIFFPQGTRSSVAVLFSAFIAWVNLDLGIETCFFHGMDANVRAWLQFVFPIYIWILVGLMILASRYSILVSRLIGPNAVPVLATLFLLSFAKLLRSIIAVVSFTYLVYPDGTEHAAWLQDGNVELFQHHHSILFFVALLFSVLYIIPLTLLVLLAPCLQAKSGYKLLRWVDNLKPLLDAYQGPYTEKFGYWTGLMLVTRIVLFIVFATNTSGDPGVNLVAILTVVFGLIFFMWNAGRVYKRCFVHINELFSLLNLGFLVALTMFYKTSNSSYRNVTFISAGMAFVNLCIISCYHSFQIFKPFQLCQCVSSAFTSLSQHFLIKKNPTSSVNSRPTAIEMNVLREPLLTSNSSFQ